MIWLLLFETRVVFLLLWPMGTFAMLKANIFKFLFFIQYYVSPAQDLPPNHNCNGLGSQFTNEGGVIRKTKGHRVAVGGMPPM